MDSEDSFAHFYYLTTIYYSLSIFMNLELVLALLLAETYFQVHCHKKNLQYIHVAEPSNLMSFQEYSSSIRH
jgi:hypothetical protein